MSRLSSSLTLTLFALGLSAANAWPQPPQPPQADTVNLRSQQTTTTGTAVSVGLDTLVVRADDGGYTLFVYDAHTTRPRPLALRSRVTVISVPSETGDTRTALSVVVDAPPPAAPASATPAPAAGEPIPPAVRRLERQVARQVRRYRVGVRAGAALDPELISIGAHAKLGPFFDSDVSFRPNLEFAFGEVTTLVALNFEGVYRLPLTPRQHRWSMYVGAGPGLHFIDRGFDADGEGDDEEDVRFDDFDLDVGLNFLMGVEFRSGLFLELKSTAYAAPHVRFLVGFNF